MVNATKNLIKWSLVHCNFIILDVGWSGWTETYYTPTPWILTSRFLLSSKDQISVLCDYGQKYDIFLCTWHHTCSNDWLDYQTQ